MDNLSDKLKAMGVRLGAPKPLPPPGEELAAPQPGDEPPGRLLPRGERKPLPIEAVVQGSYRPTIYGEIFAVETLYPAGYIHGSVPLKGNHTFNTMADWARASQLAQAQLEGFIFLDAETSGLAGGTGTFAFLVGLGRYVPQGFQLMQFFMRTPGEEAALLAALSEWIEPFEALVTYNGKSFDAPLLNTRYVLQGLNSPLLGVPHVDLLHLARRLWRERLASRSLKAIETDILGATRTQEEVPGWMVPELYFEYLRSGDASPLSGVFYHNALDVVSLAALMGHTSRMLDDPLGHLDQPGLDLVSLGRLYEDMGDLDRAIQLYEAGLERGLPEDFYWKTVARFAELYKHQKAWPPALALWQKAAGHGELYAFVELAKYYEHEQRDPAQAAEWTEQALDRVGQPAFPGYQRTIWRGELEHRLARLRAKMG